MQQSIFSDNAKYLLLKAAIRVWRNSPSLVHNLNLFLDADSLVRSAVRVDNIHLLSYDAKTFIVAHRTNHITTLIIRDAHN